MAAFIIIQTESRWSIDEGAKKKVQRQFRYVLNVL